MLVRDPSHNELHHSLKDRGAVNGIEKGIGSGASKQLAKEQAAKLAYEAMGWATRKCFQSEVEHCSYLYFRTGG